MQLWPDNVERAVGLTPEQRKMLVVMGDALQNEIHGSLLKMPDEKRTPSALEDDHHHKPVALDDYSRLI